MNLSNYFEPLRFWRLLKMELFRSKKGLVITFVVTFGFLFTGFILENIFSSSQVFDSHGVSYTFLLLTGGFILSSLAFSDLGNPLRRYSYLTLPASTFEKFMSMWVLTCIGWILMFTITFLIYSLIANSAGRYFFRNVTFRAFDPLDKATLIAMGYYILFQAIFLVGAVHFRGYVFPKTIFVVMLFGMICGLIVYLIMADIINTADQCPPGYNPFEDKPIKQFLQIVGRSGAWILAPLGWVITYIGLKEQEV
jgi:hypothetical protein